MPNTVIQLKKSATPSSVPSDLANGELAINFADGKLFYKNTAGFIAEFSGAVNSFGTVNANGTLVVSDTTGDVLTLLAGNNITIVGDAVNDRVTIGLSNEVIVPGVLYMQAVGGDEGGQIELANAVTNSTLSGNVVVDIYQNKLRFYEKNSPNKGAFIDLSIAGSGVSTNLLATSGGTTDTTARATAEAAFNKANSIVKVSNTAPTDASLWYHSALGKLFVYYTDSNSSQWVDTTRGQFSPISIDVRSDLRTINTNSNILITDSFVLANGTITLTLPAASTVSGKQYNIKNIGTGEVTLLPQSGEYIDDMANTIIGEQYTALTLLSTGSNWLIF